jgi:tetratricopeptide (TPR) repeat protein
VLLSPRETTVAQARPSLRWTAVDGAEEYLLNLVGPKPWTVHLPAGEVPCRVEEHPPGRLKVCAVPWPRDAPDLAPGPASYLAVGARVGRLGKMRTSELWSVRLREDDGRKLEASLHALRRLGLSGAEESFREAVLYERSGLRSDAASALQRSLSEAPSAPAYLLQATLELEVSLPVAALRSLREAARLAHDPTLSAEVEEARAAARRLLEDAPDEAPDDGGPEANSRLVESLREQGVQDLYGLRLGDALRHFDGAVQLAEDSGLPDLAASVRLYRGFVRALLRRDDAESDLEASSRRIAAKAPELAPFLSTLPSSVLGLASGDLDLVVAGLEKTGREYHDRLPPTYFQGLKLISLLRSERYAEAAATCQRMLSGPGLAATHPSKSSVRALRLSCSISEFLDHTARNGVGEDEIEELSHELMAAVADQPVPLRGPLRELLEQLPGEPATEAEPDSWASRIGLGSPLGQLYHLVKNVPIPLRGGLDSDLAAFAEELIALKARAGEAAAAFALGEMTRSRAHSDGLALDASPTAEPRDRAPGPPPEDSTHERSPPCP